MACAWFRNSGAGRSSDQIKILQTVCMCECVRSSLWPSLRSYPTVHVDEPGNTRQRHTGSSPRATCTTLILLLLVLLLSAQLYSRARSSSHPHAQRGSRKYLPNILLTYIVSAGVRECREPVYAKNATRPRFHERTRVPSNRAGNKLRPG
jgi:hypothetical protein